MSRRVFELEKDLKIIVSAPTNILDRVERNIDALNDSEDRSKSITTTIDVTLSGGLCNKNIKKREDFPYIKIEEQTIDSSIYSSVYYRYDIKVREIQRKGHSTYVINTFFKDDEEGVLLCIKNILYYYNLNRKRVPIHGSLLNVNNRGVLLVGHGRSGKTSLLVKILTEIGGTFISDERVFISHQNGELVGSYVPDPVKVRFASIIGSPLELALKELDMLDATQYIDIGALQKIIAAEAYDVDAGVSFSREKFTNLLQVKSAPRSKIDKIIFPRYIEDSVVKVEELLTKDALAKINRCIKIAKEHHAMGDKYEDYGAMLYKDMLANTELLSVGFNSTKQIRDYKKLEEFI